VITKRIIISICLLCFTLAGCGIVKRDYYLMPDNDKKPNGFLLRGSGWTDWKYGYAVNDVNQIENDDFIIAVKVNNFNSSYWTMGIWIVAVIPVLGLLKEGYNPKKEEYKELEVTVALFSKRDDRISLDPCKMALNTKRGPCYPSRFKYQFLEKNASCNCEKTDPVKRGIAIKERFYDVLTVNAYYNTALYPENDVSVDLPDIRCGKKSMKIPLFKFKKGSGTIYTVIL